MNRTNGRIAAESKRKIGSALFSLMKVYSYREITVTQLTQEAELSRKSFYRLFKDKDEVLNPVFDGLFYEYFTQVRAPNVIHRRGIVKLYFDFWESRTETLFLPGQERPAFGHVSIRQQALQHALRISIGKG